MKLPIDENTPLGRRERKRVATADMLAKAAYDLFERNGYEAVTMEQIASEADVARGTLYNHFPVKEALLEHYFKMEFRIGVAELLNTVMTATGLKVQLTVLFDAFASWAISKRNYLPYTIEYGIRIKTTLDASAERSDLQNLFDSLLSSAKEAGELPVTADPTFLASNLELMYFGAIVRWLATTETNPHRECRRTLDLFLEGALLDRSAGEQE